MENDELDGWGVDAVGPGWAPLVRVLFQHIRWVREHNRPWRAGETSTGYYGVEIGEDIHVEQVKEKLGTLRFYYSGGSEFFRGFVAGIEQLSGMICEQCGQPGRLRARHGWRATVCDGCAEKAGYDEVEPEE
jgi:hypothetical protein